MFFDCNAAYRKNMHPMCFYVAHPVENKTVLLPITVSSDITLMWEEYEHLLDDLLVPESLIEFVIFIEPYLHLSRYPRVECNKAILYTRYIENELFRN